MMDRKDMLSRHGKTWNMIMGGAGTLWEYTWTDICRARINECSAKVSSDECKPACNVE